MACKKVLLSAFFVITFEMKSWTQRMKRTLEKKYERLAFFIFSRKYRTKKNSKKSSLLSCFNLCFALAKTKEVNTKGKKWRKKECDKK